MLVRCTPEQKYLIMTNIKHFKDKCNEDTIKYFIVNQMPEAIKKQQRQTNEPINGVKEKDQGVT